MKNIKNYIDEIYEFFDEVIGSIVPGVYFCSYIYFNILAVIFVFNLRKANGTGIITLVVLCISYVLGTMFRRSNSREPDYASAKYIYYKSCPHDDNNYAFANIMSNSIYEETIERFINTAKETEIRYNKNIIKKRLSNLETFKINILKKSENRSYLSKAYVLKYVYKKLDTKLKKLEKHEEKNKDKIITIKKLLDDEDISLKDYRYIYIDYPYSNLNKYLVDRKLNELAEYVSWNMEDDSTITSRSKSLICNMKIEIHHKSPKDYGHLLKSEAHIRFMNAMWYANKTLTKIIIFITVVSGVLGFTTLAVLNNNLLAKFYKNNSGMSQQVAKTIDTLKNAFSTISTNGQFADNVIMALILIFMISLVYLVFSYIIKITIKNNFHYQRIREVVSILSLYDLIKKEEIADVKDIGGDSEQTKCGCSLFNVKQCFKDKSNK